MTNKRIPGPDPIATVYRNKDKPKRYYDFVAMTGQMDDNKFDDDAIADTTNITIPNKVLKENEESFDFKKDLENNDASPYAMAERHNSVEKALSSSVGLNTDRKSNIISNAILPYKTKHKLASEHMHHDLSFDFKNKNASEHILPADKMLHELSSKGHPNEKLAAKMTSAIDSFKETHPEYHRYLKKKYDFATNPETKPFVHYTGEENALAKSEILAHQDKYKFYHGRSMTKEGVTGHFQLHHNGDINRVPAMHAISGGHEGAYNSHPFQTKEQREVAENHEAEMHDTAHHHIEKSPLNQSIKHYTSDSGQINKTLANLHSGEQLSGRNQESLPKTLEHSENISSLIKSAPKHENAFHVFTGLSKSTDIGKQVRENKTKRPLVAHLPAFSSTSLSPNIADTFAKPKTDPEFNQNVTDVLHIAIPKNYKHGLYIGHNSDYGTAEKEYLMDKGHYLDVHHEPKHYAIAGQIHRLWSAKPNIEKE